MSARGLLTRAVVWLAVVVTGAVAVAGGIALHGAGVLAVVLAGIVAGCLRVAAARESAAPGPRHAVADAAWRASVGTVVVLLVLAGSVVLAGRAAPVVVVLCAGLVALAWWLRRRSATDRRPGTATPPPAAAPPSGPDQLPARPAGHPATRRSPHPSGRGVAPDGPGQPALPPAAGLSVDELGREWRRTAAVLEGGVDPATRARLVRRRGEVLDELERRDPAGFARWLAQGASADGDPARHLRGDSAAGPGPG